MSALCWVDPRLPIKMVVMDLLKNAIGSIRVGVEDSRSTDPARLLSAVRDIHSGILLLYKEALRRLSPANSDEVLLMALIRPKLHTGGAVTFVGGGSKTVDVQQIRERFSALEIKTEWHRFDRISKLRNDAEHYYPQATTEQLRGLISDAFILVHEFVVTQLHEDLKALLGENAWQQMIEISEVYERERRECRKMLESISWELELVRRGVVELECEGCGSGLLQPNKTSGSGKEVELVCRACDRREDGESFKPRAIEIALGPDWYLYVDGYETRYVTCPECLQEAYLINERRCESCGHEEEPEELN